MKETAEHFISESREFLSAKYLPKIELCLAQLTDEDVWWRPNEESNSIGNLVLHLEGNVREWLVGGVGNLPFERVRQREFDERQMISRAELIERLRKIIGEADAVLASLDVSLLTERRQIQGRDTTVLRAIYHVVEHFSMHAGQIFLLTKMRTEKDLRLYP
ncbi:MAG: DUF1572 family protein [Acidobacteria bacterium]|nr:DUF1572 family protein [Acidobacteriota bacterium]